MSWCASWPGVTRARSGRCRGALALLLVALAPRSGPSAEPAFPVSWIQPSPADASEEALAAALADLPNAEALVGRLGALARVAESFPGSTGGGLARLAGGFVLLDNGRFEEAAVALQHPDVARTSLVDHALLGLARAHEGRRDPAAAEQAYSRLLSELPTSPLLCSALFRRADALAAAGRSADAIASLGRALGECSGRAPQILLRLGVLHERRGEKGAAALAYDTLERDHPTAFETREASRRLRGVRGALPPMGADESRRRSLDRAQALLDAGRTSDALKLLRALRTAALPPEQAETVRVRLARTLVVLDRDKEAETLLRAVPASSAFAAEAAYHLARIAYGRRKSLDGYEDVVERFPASAWAEEALYTMAFHHGRELREPQALPHYRRLLALFPAGRYVDQAAWAAAWWDFHHGQVAAAAGAFEAAARERPRGPYTARFLYWAARARAALGETEASRALYEETARRFKHLYHGLKAGEALGLVRSGASSTRPAAFLPAPPEPDVPGPVLTRVRQLLLIHRLEEVEHELDRVQPSAQVHATRAWIQWRAGRLRPAIISMKRAFPDWGSERGDALPDPVWRILYPMRYQDELLESARGQDLDASLVAGVIWQESTFDATAESTAGAVGLMQVMPRTGRALARSLGLRYRRSLLTDPGVGLRMGTLYLRTMIDSHGGRVERALAAYNAGPGRVRSWTAARPGMPAEDFIESIPFTETRNYVMGILAHREHYRRLYGLPPSRARTATAARP